MVSENTGGEQPRRRGHEGRSVLKSSHDHVIIVSCLLLWSNWFPRTVQGYSCFLTLTSPHTVRVVLLIYIRIPRTSPQRKLKPTFGMEYTFGGKYKLEEEIGYGGCGTRFLPLRFFVLMLYEML